MKRRYIILGVIALMLVIGLIVYMMIKKNDSQNIKNENEVSEDSLGERITRAEAIRLFSFFFYTDTEREALSKKASFQDAEGKWYESYANAAVHAGYLLNEKRLRAEEKLSCGEFRDMLVRVCQLCHIAYAEVYAKLPERLHTVKNQDDLLLEEFIYLYSLCLEICLQRTEQATSIPIQRTSFLVVSQREENGIPYFVTEDGSLYRAQHFQDYTDFFETAPDGRDQSSKNTFREYPNAETYIYSIPNLLRCGTEIVFIFGFDDRAITIPNVLVQEGNGKKLRAFVNGDAKEFTCALPLAESIQQEIADITIQEKKVTAITIKPDRIDGKVLVTGDGQIEISGYGSLPLDEDYRIYKLYGTLSMERTNSILVGYENVSFVVSGGKICAALIREAIKAETIRVLISVDRTANYLHDTVEISSDAGLLMTIGDTVTEYAADEVVRVDYKKLKQEEKRIVFSALSDSGKISICSIQRSYGVPAYRGKIEIAAGEGGLLVVNELPLEEYLYSVVPSEMPTSHGEEALKVQAVCARSYAYQQVMANRYANYGAHIDDTVNSQVYNNVPENNASIYAVKDTYGKVLEYQGTVVNAFYFSTSCGSTASIEEVWSNYAPVECFTGQLQLTAASKYPAEEAKDLSDEERFRDFIQYESLTFEAQGKNVREKVDTYDSGFNWYRWNVTMDADALSKQLDRLLLERYEINPAEVLTMVSKEGSFTTPSGTVIEGCYEPFAISTVGTVIDIEPVTRAKSGILLEILIRGTANTVLVRNQTNIRTLLAPLKTTVYLDNDATVDGFALLPSAYFYVEKKSEGKNAEFTFYGGGYGHGVGMSQNGVKRLIEEGCDYEAVLRHYYKGVTLSFIY